MSAASLAWAALRERCTAATPEVRNRNEITCHAVRLKMHLRQR